MLGRYYFPGSKQMRRFGSLSTIAVLGLSVGFACVMLISVWMMHEIQYDRFYEHTDRIYKVFLEENVNGKKIRHPWVPFPIAQTLQEKIPEITNGTIVKGGSVKVKYNENHFYENRVCFTDPEIFELFGLTFISGSEYQALQHKNSIVINEKTGLKYFGTENPVGKTLLINDDYSFEITAVVKDLPQNSSIDYDFFILAKYFSDPFIFNGTNWEALNFNSYVLLKKHSDPNKVRDKIKNILMEHTPDRGRYINIQLIKKSHLYAVSGKPTNIKNIRVMAFLGLVIYLVALINFLNISLGRFHKHSFEFKNKRIWGAGKKQIALQILTDNLVVILISMILAGFTIYLTLPLLEQLTGITLSVNNFLIIRLLLIIGAIIFISLFVSVIPLVVIHIGRLNFLFNKNVETLNPIKGYQSFFIIFQLASSIALIIAVIVITHQLNFISNKDIGLDLSNVVTAQLSENDREKYPILKDELLNLGVVRGVTAAYNLPTNIYTSCNITAWPGNPHQEKIELAYTISDKDYFSTLGITILQGIPFSKKLQSDSVAYILNEKAVKAMNLENPTGVMIDFGCWKEGKVVGVVKDFNYRSMHSPVEPLIIANHTWGAQHLIVKLNRDITTNSLSQLEKTWKKINPQSSANFQPLENSLKTMYTKDKNFRSFLMACSAVALILSSMGLFSLIFIHSERRTKEIGIRKVNGAKVYEILLLLNKEFLMWLAIAFTFTAPLAWYIMNKWLQNFAYRIDLSWWMFALAGVVTLIISLLTVSWQSCRAARRNPIESLRYE